jgi:hypothetical protein
MLEIDSILVEGKRFFSSAKVHTGSGAHPALTLIGTGVSFLGYKATRA